MESKDVVVKDVFGVKDEIMRERCTEIKGKGNVVCMRVKRILKSSFERESDFRENWKEYFEDLYKADIEEQVTVIIWGFKGDRRGNYLMGEPLGKTELEARVKN